MHEDNFTKWKVKLILSQLQSFNTPKRAQCMRITLLNEKWNLPWASWSSSWTPHCFQWPRSPHTAQRTDPTRFAPDCSVWRRASLPSLWWSPLRQDTWGILPSRSCRSSRSYQAWLYWRSWPAPTGYTGWRTSPLGQWKLLRSPNGPSGTCRCLKLWIMLTLGP